VVNWTAVEKKEGVGIEEGGTHEERGVEAIRRGTEIKGGLGVWMEEKVEVILVIEL